MTVIVLLGLLALNAFVTVQASSTEDTRGQLIFAHVLHRHGDRTPTQPYPTDPYNSESDWPVPWGALTVRGMQQHYALGQWFRQRYGNVLLSHKYSPNEIYVRSTDVDRTLESSLANLAGLYPPQGDQIWNANLQWQPIPVHTVDANDDYLIGAITSCPVYDAALNSLDTTKEFHKLYADSRPFMNYAAKYSGYMINGTLSGLMNIVSLRDTLFVEQLYNKTLPEWTEAIYPCAEIDRLSQLYYIVPAFTPQLAKIRSGFLIKDILDRMQTKFNGTLSPDRSVFVYSTHDSILSTLLYALGISDNQFVQYTATVLFELRSTSTGPNVEIFYKKSSATDEATPLYIPDCGYSCPLFKLYDLYANIIPTEDYATTCQLQ